MIQIKDNLLTLKRLSNTVLERLDRREKIHFLHIGKNAGSQFRQLAHQFNQLNSKYVIIQHSHNKRLSHLRRNALFLFSIRSPETRFKSAFYSRKRKGQPRYYMDHSPDEKRAFAYFQDANELAEALFDQGERGRQAFCAMKSIYHCATDQVDWFDGCGYFFEIHPPLYILRQETFTRDLKVFFDRIGFPMENLQLSDDDVVSHRNNYLSVPALSEKALANLRDWYCQDFEFYRICESWIEAQSGYAGGLN